MLKAQISIFNIICVKRDKKSKKLTKRGGGGGGGRTEEEKEKKKRDNKHFWQTLTKQGNK